eukprot:559260-Lingulodinium_polyedra.AAC.1
MARAPQGPTLSAPNAADCRRASPAGTEWAGPRSGSTSANGGGPLRRPGATAPAPWPCRHGSGPRA